MKNKKTYKSLSQLLLIVLIVMGAGLFIIFQNACRSDLQEALDSTISFTKLRINRCSAYQSNDQVKSLVRLMDKTTELSENLAEWDSADAERLDRYAREQRLNGAVVLDQDLQPVLQTSKAQEAADLWNDMIQTSYVSDILDYPQKTYTTRLTVNGVIYDFAAAARRDADGLVITYVQKEPLSEENGDLVLSSLFADFPFEMNGIVVVCDDTQVLSSNDTGLLGLSVEECKELYQGEFSPDSDRVVRLRSGKSTWYGRRDATENYSIYMFFPASQVFMKRNIVCVVYVLAAVLIYMVLVLGQNQAEKAVLAREQRRLRTINAIGRAYSSISVVDLREQEVEVIKGAQAGDAGHGRWRLEKSVQQEHVSKWIAEPCREEYLKFVDMDTVAERLEGQQSLSYTCQKADGSWMLSLIVAQRYNKEGKVDGVLLASRDVTAEKQREIEQDTALRNALASAEHANKAKTVFLNNMSHDIRTPMNAIIGFTALAVSHIENQEHVLEYLKKINTAGKHLLSLINDVLDMSRIENGSVKIEEAEVHLPDVMHDLRAIIQGNIGAKQQDLFIDTQDVVHEDIFTDKLRLNQVLLNIMSNAVKFTPVGGTINVRVIERKCSREGYATYEFRIRDNGIGIDPAFQEHIFDSFARERSVTESGIQGTGLGLAIAKNIIDMMKGTITLSSEKGKGSEFVVTLDCRLAGQTTAHCETIPELQGARALVADDDINTCMSVSKMLRKIGMQADWTASGKEAVMRAKEAFEEDRAFAAYIIDWMMPDMNGIETVRRIRNVIGADTPIIILTAYDWTDIEEEARAAGVTAFVAKPIFFSELQEVLSGSAAEEKEPQEITANNHVGKNILLVEDNELNREIAIAILEDAGINVDAVNDGTDAVERMASAAEDQYDLILMDIQMPRMDGYTATREIRTLGSNKKANIPIIAMTANAFEEDRRKAFEAGMNGHISKPISIEAILEALDGLG